MKKFVGYVNGKTFENEEDFNKAAQEAIKSGEDNLSISSYYKYSNDNEIEEKDPNYVTSSEYILGDVKPVDGEYLVSDELKKKIQDASNKDEIKEYVTKYQSKFDEVIEDATARNENLEDEIKQLQEKLYENQENIKELKARSKYYSVLNGLLVEDKKETKKPVTKESVKDILGVKNDGSLLSLLKELGFLK